MNKNNRKKKGLCKRVLALMLCCFCLLATIPISAFALESGETQITEERISEQQSENTSESLLSLSSETSESQTDTQQSTSDEIIESVLKKETDTEIETEVTAEAGTETNTETGTDAAVIDTETGSETGVTAEAGTETNTETNAADSETEAGSETEVNCEAGNGTDAVDPACTCSPVNGVHTDSCKLYEAPEVDTSAVDALFAKLMAFESYEALDAYMSEEMTEEEYVLMDSFTEEQNYALSVKVDELNGYAVATLEQNSYNITMVQGEDDYFTAYGISEDNFSCSCSHEAAITAEVVTDYGYYIIVDSNVAPGEYTLTVNYQTTSWITGETQQNQDIITITVTEAGAEEAMIFYLKTPTSDPDSNESDQWGDTIGNGTVKTNGAIWVDGKNIFNPGQYVISMANGMVKQEDGSWLLPKENYYAHYEAIFEAYKSELEAELDMSLDSVEDIEAIYLIPHKISQGNYTDPDKHIDCTISVKTEKVFTAKFWVTLPNGTQNLVEANNYKIDSTVAKTTLAPTGEYGDYPETMTVEGVTYRFDGWYNEANQHVADDKWAYTPDETELSDGTVNFYARYVQSGANLTVQKTVSGNMYDANKEFVFTVTYGDETKTFNLKKDGTHTIKNVPVGATITVTEDPDGYTYSFVSITGNITTRETNNGVSFTMPSQDVTVVINNDKTVTVDTGISLETLPYILILGVVAVGALLLIKKRRNRDDD